MQSILAEAAGAQLLHHAAEVKCTAAA
jgi:hypothetical protein